MLRRNTKQRQMILDELQTMPGHPTAGEIFDVVRKRLPGISLGTVYRNLDLLSRSGLITKLDQGPGQTRFDSAPDWHLHIRCANCGELTDLPEISSGLQQLSGNLLLQGHEVLGIRAEYVGICPDCRRKLTSLQKAQLVTNLLYHGINESQPH